MRTVRIGRVSGVHYESGMVDIIFSDEDDMVYQNLPLFSDAYQMPQVNDVVTVVFQSNSGTTDQGYVIGRPYSEKNTPEVTGRGVYFKKFSDTAYIRYYPDTDTLEIAAGHVTIKEKGG